MFKKIIFTIAIIIETTITMAQQIPVGECGIVYIHDAAGNRTRRLYYCNNGGPYPSFKNQEEPQTNFAKTNNIANAVKENHIEFAQIDAIFPNPTDGKFSITFSKSINNASIIIADVNGKVLQRINASGTKVDFNLLNFSSGVYFVKIIEKGSTSITKKIIKN